jgi:hypothetical protein
MAPVLQDYRVNNLPTIDAPPGKKVFAITVKFFIDHYSITSITPHVDLLGFIPHASSPVRLLTFNDPYRLSSSHPFFRVGYSLPLVDSNFRGKFLTMKKAKSVPEEGGLY